MLRRNIVYFWKQHVGVVLGASLCTMVLVGALLVGDSVKHSLRGMAEYRIGQVDMVLFSEDRFFRQELADELDKKLTATVAPVFILRGSISNPDADEEAGEKSRVPNVQILGVDPRFFQLSPSGQDMPLEDGQVHINETLAQTLGIGEGATLNLRLEEPALFSRDAPLSGTSDKVARISRQKVSSVLGPEQFGNFALHGSQIPPYTLMLPIQTLRDGIEAQGNRANLLLLGKSSLSQFSTENANQALEKAWTLGDAGIQALEVNNGTHWSLRSGSIFINPVLEAGFRKTGSGSSAGVLSYLINSFESGEKSAPYSFSAAYENGASSGLPDDLGDDQVVVNQWLADDLNLTSGSELTLKYFVPKGRRELSQAATTFKVHSVLPMPEKFEKGKESDWTPAFPGLTDEENCRDWEPGFAVDESRIRDKDEDYWDDFRGTPKAYVNLVAGQKMWGNRWGMSTGIRIPKGDQDLDELKSRIKQHISAKDAGLEFIPLRERAMISAKGSINLGEYIGYFSFFIIVAALALTGMLFIFSIEQRNQQTGLLLATGFTPGRIRKLFLLEGMILSTVGSLLGIFLGLGYAKALLWGLANVWDGLTGAMLIRFSANVQTLVIGGGGGVAMATLSIWVALRKQLRREPRELLHAGDQLEISGQSRPTGRLSHLLGVLLFVIALLQIAFSGGSGGTQATGNFFVCGFIFLLAALFYFNGRLARIAYHNNDLPDISVLGFRNTARRRGRSLVTIGVLAAGVFMVVAVSSFQTFGEKDWTKKSSGTGGFAITAKSAIPIYDDLNTERGREEFGLDPEKLEGVYVVPFRVRQGGDASCLNLNKTSEPTLLGVNPSELKGRFQFADKKNGWLQLDDLTEGMEIVPGIADQNTVQYGLGLKPDGLITYKDETGKPFQVRIVAMVQGSVLQGRIIIAENRFVEKFPSQAGYTQFLVDTPAEKLDHVVAHLTNTLRDQGMEAHPAWLRLSEFLAVQNTYLSIFQALGGLGLLIGSAGLGIVVARNLLERRREFGLLEALGYPIMAIRKMAIVEHRWLLTWGLAAGTATALIAVWPAILNRQEGIPFKELGILVLLLGMTSLFWIFVATQLSLKNSTLPALREE